MSVEHRAAPAISAVSLHLATNGEAVALVTTERHVAEPTPSIMPAAPPTLSTVEQRVGSAAGGRRFPADGCRTPEALPHPERHADRGAR
jgi:hypothetical protein